MERLTCHIDGNPAMDCKKCERQNSERCTALGCRNLTKDRLAAYEDTGLEPSEINTSTMWQSELEAYHLLGTVEELTELVKAKQDVPFSVKEMRDTVSVLNQVLNDGNGLRLWPLHCNIARYAVNKLIKEATT